MRALPLVTEKRVTMYSRKLEMACWQYLKASRLEEYSYNMKMRMTDDK